MSQLPLFLFVCDTLRDIRRRQLAARFVGSARPQPLQLKVVPDVLLCLPCAQSDTPRRLRATKLATIKRARRTTPIMQPPTCNTQRHVLVRKKTRIFNNQSGTAVHICAICIGKSGASPMGDTPSIPGGSVSSYVAPPDTKI